LIRKKVHVWVSVSLFAMIMLFSAVQDESVVAAIFTAANYTYGPLLGLFAFGLSNRRAPNDYWIPWIAVFSPLFCFALETWLQQQFNFSFGFALLPVNGLTTFLGLFLISRNSSTRDS
jgi:hypothetical protein